MMKKSAVNSKLSPILQKSKILNPTFLPCHNSLFMNTEQKLKSAGNSNWQNSNTSYRHFLNHLCFKNLIKMVLLSLKKFEFSRLNEGGINY